jgi:hypothetical protein
MSDLLAALQRSVSAAREVRDAVAAASGTAPKGGRKAS